MARPVGVRAERSIRFVDPKERIGGRRRNVSTKAATTPTAAKNPISWPGRRSMAMSEPKPTMVVRLVKRQGRPVRRRVS